MILEVWAITEAGDGLPDIRATLSELPETPTEESISLSLKKLYKCKRMGSIYCCLLWLLTALHYSSLLCSATCVDVLMCPSRQVYDYVCVCTCHCVCVYVRMCLFCMHACIHVCIHTYLRTHARIRAPFPPSLSLLKRYPSPDLLHA